MGRPQIATKGLPGNRVEPYLAGITATIILPCSPKKPHNLLGTPPSADGDDKIPKGSLSILSQGQSISDYDFIRYLDNNKLKIIYMREK